jgi:predicted metal-dependent peptidase
MKTKAPPTNTDRLHKLLKARVQMLFDHPFFGALAAQMNNTLDPNCPTACTNGKAIRWGPAFLDSLSEKETVSVMIHEILHCSNGHTWRRKTRDPLQWNVACDKAINHILVELNLPLPEDAILPSQSEQGRAAEMLYCAPPPAPSNGDEDGDEGEAGDETQPDADGEGSEDGEGDEDATEAATGSDEDGDEGSDEGGDEAGAENGAQTQPDADGEGSEDGERGSNAAEAATGSEPGNGQPRPTPDPGRCGAVEDAPGGDEGARQQEAEWRVAVIQAASTTRGTLPGDLQRLVDELVHPRIPWEVLLRDFIERTARNDYLWSRPNRRYVSSGIVLPSLVSEELPEIVIAVDTSGSIGADQLNQFAAEVSAVLGAYETTIRVVYCDASVQGTETFTRADLPLKLSPRGGGGTNFRPVFKWVEDEHLSPAAVIYLTDGCGEFPTQEPDHPVLWIMTTDAKAPIGETIRMQ